MIVLGFDTATPRTAVALLDDMTHNLGEAVHDPEPGERPGHASQLLPLALQLIDEAGLTFADVQRLAVGVGPGTFTGLRIGLATARSLAQATRAELVGVSSLEALAEPVDAPAVLAVLDARRGEAFVGGWAGAREVLAPRALTPDALARVDPPNTGGTWLAVGDGAVRFRAVLERAGVTVPPDDDPAHRISALATCRLAAKVREPAVRDALVPTYLRQPDATTSRRD